MEPSKIPVSHKYCTAVVLDVNRVGVARGGCRCGGKGVGDMGTLYLPLNLNLKLLVKVIY